MINAAIANFEALTPVFHSIGCSLAVGLVPNAERTNVIVEGITDYLYLNAMMDVLGMKNANRFYFIPCQGFIKQLCCGCRGFSTTLYHILQGINSKRGTKINYAMNNY